MKTIYLSGKIAGLFEIIARENFDKAAWELKREHAVGTMRIINPLDLPNLPNMEWKDFILRDLLYLSKCDAIYMLANWQDSKGARVEHEFAKGLGIEILYQDENTREI